MGHAVVKASILLMLAYAVPWPAFGQKAPAPMVQVESFSIEQGLSDRNVNYFAKDRQGFLWVATFNGLDRFDGYDFLNYNSRPRNPHQIRLNKVFSVLPDRAGQLLITYDDGGVGPMDRLDPLTGRCTPFEFAAQDSFQGKYKAFCRATDGALYFLVNRSTWSMVFRFEEKTGTFVKILEGNLMGKQDIDYASLLKASDGTFWFAFSREEHGMLTVVQTDDQGLMLHRYTQDNFSPAPGPFQEPVALTEAPDGHIWLTMTGRHVYVIDPAGGAVFNPHPQLPPAGYEFARDKKGNLLAYQSNPTDRSKACYLLAAEGQVINYSWIFDHQTLIDQVFSDDFTRGLMAGTGNGFNNYQLRPERFRTYLARELGNAPYGMSIRGMAKMGRDRLFIASEREGIFELDLSTNSLVPLEQRLPALDTMKRKLFPKNVLAQGDSVLWMPCAERVLKYTLPTNQLTLYPVIITGIARNELWGMVAGRPGNFWLISYAGQLLDFDPRSGQPTVYHNRDGSQPFEGTKPTFLLAGRAGTLWVGTASSGLFRVDPEKGESRRYSADPGDPSGFNSNQISCIYEDPAGLLWVGTLESGLHVFDPAKGRVTAVYSRENGLLNNSTVGILPDEKGNYWVSTYSGLSYLDTKLKTFRNYTVADGLSHNEFNRFSYFFDPDYGRFYFGGMNGINAFDQKDLDPASNDVPLLVTEMSVTGQQGRVTVQNEGIVDGSTLVLPPGSRFLHLKLALGTYFNPGGNQYSYRIEGLDQDWNYLGINRNLRIDHLPAGNYTLHLRGADDRGNWSSREIMLHLRVQQFWYKRWWAYLLYAALLASGSYFFYRFQLRRRLAEKETQRLQQLDTFKTRFFTNISHEFRTPLTVILGMVDSLKKHLSGSAEPEQAAEMIRRNSRHLLNLVNQLLDLSRLEAGKLQLSPANGDLAAFLQYQLESFRSYAQTRRIDLQFHSETPGLPMAFDPEKMQAILVNLLSNALKFTPEGGRIEVALRNEAPAQVVVEVRDTGIGIPADQLGHIFERFYQVDDSMTRKGEGTGVGLALVNELVKLMQGGIMVESTIGEGTLFQITLPYTPPLPQLQTAPAWSAPDEAPVHEIASDFGEGTEEDARPLLLLVEDNADVRHYIAGCVKNEYRVVTAVSGAEGIEQAIEHTPDIIISDVMMPEKDGFELCETLKNDERTSHIPIVLLTARADFDSRIAGLKRGADDYLAKPFEPAELQIRLDNLVQQRRRLQQRYSSIPQLPERSQDPGLVLEDAFLRKIREVVEAHISETDFDMPQLEQALGMSRSQVFRKVKALTGASPSLLIRSIRLHKAKELLRDETLTIAEVAYEVGFSTPAYFSTTFLEEFGKTPGEWRKG